MQSSPAEPPSVDPVGPVETPFSSLPPVRAARNDMARVQAARPPPEQRPNGAEELPFLIQPDPGLA